MPPISHYQRWPDSAASASPPSVNPSYANPQNEVWLDFTTDAGGDARSTTTQQSKFDTACRRVFAGDAYEAGVAR